jgi:hypothetical protein
MLEQLEGGPLRPGHYLPSFRREHNKHPAGNALGLAGSHTTIPPSNPFAPVK